MDCEDSKRGKFIAFEGIDGSGTTAQVRELAKVLIQDHGLDVYPTAEPSESPLGKMVRRALQGHEKFCPEAMALLFAADRADHVESVIKPALRMADVVICDRYVWSSYVYQGIATGDAIWVDEINKWAMQPDLVVYLKIDPRIAAERREARSEGNELYDMMEMQEQVAKEYDELAKDSQTQMLAFGPNAGIAPVFMVDASKSLMEVHSDILVGVLALLETGEVPSGRKL